MYATANKKMLNMLILEILETYSDEEHQLTQKEIINILQRDYGMECDRRSVSNNIKYLHNLGFDVNENPPYYLASREFDEAELRMLIDSVLFSKNLSGNMAKQLIKKLETLGNKYFKSKVSHVAATSSLVRTENKQVLYTVNAINDAIDQKKKISFRYNRYETDMKLHDRGKDYVMNPYQMVAANGRYYLLGNIDKYDNVTYYRIDRMSDVTVLDDKVKPMSQVKDLENGLDLPKHMAEHIYMFHGESVAVKLRCKTDMMDNLIDWFGKDIRVLKAGDDEISVRVVCNYDAMFCWALQYGPYVEVTEPKRLREDLAKAINKMAEKYKD